MEKEKKIRILYLDVIKLIAAICVFTCHYTRTLEYYGISYKYKVLPDSPFHLYLGSVGVSLFFIISGTSLMMIYGDELDVIKYFRKRFVAIYPMFWIVYLFFLGVNSFNTNLFDGSIEYWKIVYSVLGIDGSLCSLGMNFYQVGEWFLGVIITLYIIFPILRKPVNAYPWIMLIISITIGVMLNFKWSSAYPIECFFVARIPEFVFGMVFIKFIKKTNLLTALVATFVLILMSLTNVFDSVIMMKTYLVGISLFLVLVYIFQNIQGEHWAMISRFASKNLYPIFLIHHQLQFMYLKNYSGNSFNITQVLFSWGIIFILTIVMSYFVDKIVQCGTCFINSRKKTINNTNNKDKFCRILILILLIILVVLQYKNEIIHNEVNSQVNVSDLNAEVVLNTAPQEVVVGEKKQIQIIVKNTGNEDWSEEKNIRLCIWHNGQDLGYRINLDAGQIISPGEEHTFILNDFILNDAVETALEFQMVCEGITYFGEKELIYIKGIK